MRVLAAAAVAITMVAAPMPSATADECTIESGCICAVLRIVFPPEGDVILPVVGMVRDCTPHGRG